MNELRVAVVTGSTRGLGRAYAVSLLERGMHVVLNGRGELEDPPPASPGQWGFVRADVSSSDQAQALIEAAIDRFGRLDVLVSNAGVYRDRSLLKTSDEEFLEVIASHLLGTFYCGRAAARAMKAEGSGGRIINVSSDSVSGSFGQSSYSAAKAAIAAMTLTWSIELGRYGIMVNAIFPNGATEPVLEVPRLAERWGYGGPFPRSMGEPREAAPLVAFLACSEEAATISGQLLALGGDRLALWQGFGEAKVAFKEHGWNYEDLDRLLLPLLGSSFRRPGFDPGASPVGEALSGPA